MTTARHASRRCLSCQRRVPTQCWQVVTPTGVVFATCSALCLRTLVTAAESALNRWVASSVVLFPGWRPSRRSAIDVGRPFGVIRVTGTDG